MGWQCPQCPWYCCVSPVMVESISSRRRGQDRQLLILKGLYWWTLSKDLRCGMPGHPLLGPQPGEVVTKPDGSSKAI